MNNKNFDFKDLMQFVCSVIYDSVGNRKPTL